jgi:NADPH-dependent curcumin reductase CurA
MGYMGKQFTMKNRTILLDKRPLGKPTTDVFKFVEGTIPQPENGEVLLKTNFVSVDPYLRGRMNSTKSYIAPFNVNEPVKSGIVAEVIDSRNNQFSKGDIVTGMLDWSEYQVSIGTGLIKVNADVKPHSVYQGILGMTGLTAYLGFTEIGLPKAGETLVL